MLDGRVVRLRTIEPQDLDRLADLANNRQVRASVVGWDWPVARHTQADWLSTAGRNSSTYRLAVGDPATNDVWGLTGLWDLDWHNQSATTAIKLLPGSTPKGAGTDAIMLVMAWAFYEIGLRRLWSTILDFNGASIGAYVKNCGWSIEGREREAVFRKGRWHDLIRVAMLKRDFDNLPNAAEYVERVCPIPTNDILDQPLATGSRVSLQAAQFTQT